MEAQKAKLHEEAKEKTAAAESRVCQEKQEFEKAKAAQKAGCAKASQEAECKEKESAWMLEVEALKSQFKEEIRADAQAE